MAIAIDQANLGKTVVAGGSTTVAFTTIANVASGGFIVVCVGWFGSTSALSSVSGGSLSWTIDKQGRAVSNSVAIASAQAPSGLASGTTITATFPAADMSTRSISGLSFTGVKTSSPVDGTPVGPTDSAVAGWSTDSYSIAAGSVIVAIDFNGFGPANNNTATSPSVEAHEAVDPTDFFGHVVEYRIESSAGSYTVAGSWGTFGDRSGNIGVAYLAGATTPDTGLAWIRT